MKYFGVWDILVSSCHSGAEHSEEPVIHNRCRNEFGTDPKELAVCGHGFRVSAAARPGMMNSRIPYRRATDRIGGAAVGPLECIDPAHIVLVKYEVEHLDIFGNAGSVRGTRYCGNDVLLHQPTQCDLRGGLAVAPADVSQHN